ncbi:MULTISPECIES: Do family serine endopeptidase [unclassified Brevundimonas]|uniref:Do family serine endopeptidase n=1 Tax=unclassified Brevundimonas TaxID=2622653 RepID=UPI000700CCC4|nr:MULTISPECIES: Do family serine endopeptidase [unclassified Brevundimonas]KQY71033.1 serine protease [Brevundimonas sp. Root1423]KRA26479.1 serine protease [Brevundimonas sp. Root608]
MMKRKEFMLGAVAGLAFAAAATAGGVIDWPSAEAGPVAGVSGRLAPSAGGGLAFAPPQGAPLSFADIFAQVAPAVVQIEVKTRVQRPNMIQVPGMPFAIPNPNGAPGGEEGEDGEGATALGAGSGFFISADGFIATNNHVVADATEIRVKLADGREMEARLVGRDEATDLAVIKVEGADFPFVSFEEQAQPRVGDWVIAVGNPFGLGGTATAGIVSALARQNVDDQTSQYVDFLQIDAAINRGNSGGPTFDIYGRVIGVNSAIYSQTGGSVGIGFAIPASIAKGVTEQLMRNGRVERGYVGVGLRTLSPDGWEALGQPRDFKGALIENVTEGAPADRAGARIDDYIVAVNGKPVADSTEASRLVGQARPGETIRLEIIRDGRRQTLNVRAGARPSEQELAAADGSGSGGAAAPPPPAATGEAVEGLSVAPLSPTLRSRYDLPDNVNGVLITNVARSTPAARLGLQAGFVITRVNTRNVTSAADVRAAVAAAKQAGRPSVLLFIRTPQGNVVAPLKFDDGE